MDIYTRLCREETLWEAWRKVRKKNARGGLDGKNPSDLDQKIEKIIADISLTLTQETYSPVPFDRMKVPKFNEAGEWRALSLPVVTDKVVQQALVNLMTPEFEEDFLDCSYAYRARKGPVRAIRRVEHILTTTKAKWVAKFDIDNFFDSLNHDYLISLVKEKLDDGRLLNLIRLWLNAGYISRKGDYIEPDEGIAQGAVVSPLLSNIYLHPLDRYAVKKEYPYVRYSDNLISMFADKDSAFVCHEDIRGFLKEELSLELNPDPNPIKSVKGGFTFLGIFFKGKERFISRQKETKTFKKLNWLTEKRSASDPEIAISRLNESIKAQKRFYSFIKPDRQFSKFDAHLQKRMPGLLTAFNKKGLLTSKDESLDFIKRIEFYTDQKIKEKLTIAKNIVEETFVKIKQSDTEADNRTSDAAKKASALAKRSSAQKNRYLKQVASGAEVVVSTPGIFIGKTGQRLILREARKNILEHPFSKVRQITVTTNGVSLSSDVIWSCGTQKVPLAFINRRGLTYATLQNPTHSQGDLSVLQIRMLETERALKLAKKILKGKSRNQMNLIKFYTRHRSKTDPIFSEQASIALDRMDGELKKLQEVSLNGSFEKTKNELFTTEARISSHYWQIIKMLLPSELRFTKRDKRGASDVVNNMLNYGYAILYQRVWRAITTAGLNPNISFLHSFQKNKPTLVFDMVEEFRQAIVDRPLFSLMTRGNRYQNFRIDANTGLLDKFTKEIALLAVLNRLATLMNFRGKKIRAEDILQNQARHLARFVRKEKRTYKPFISAY